MDEIEQKGLLLDQEKVTRVDFSFNAVRNTCFVRQRYLVITEIKLKLKGNKTNTNESHGNFASMRCETQPYEKIILCKFISNMFLRRKPALCA